MALSNDPLCKEMIEANKKWLEALLISAQATATLYAKKDMDGVEAVLLPTVLGKVCNTDALRTMYFDHFCAKKPIGTIDEAEAHLLNPKAGERVVNFMGHYTFSLQQADGSRTNVPARFTFTYKETPRGWIITHHHSSAMPAEREFGHHAKTSCCGCCG